MHNEFQAPTWTKLKPKGVPEGITAAYLDDGLGQLHPLAQQTLEVLPLLLQGPQVCLQLLLRLLIRHGEEVPADLQSVDEGGLIALKLQLGVLKGIKQASVSLAWSRGSAASNPHDVLKS